MSIGGGGNNCRRRSGKAAYKARYDRYRVENRRERNKIRAFRRHLRKFPADRQAIAEKERILSC